MTWKKTSCALCAQNCGLEVLIENNRIAKVRGDKSNLRSEGYACRKGLNIAFYQHHADRLMHPLKKVDGRFQQISWDLAIDEIAKKLKHIIDEHGPRSYAYMGGGGQGCSFEAGFGVRLMRGLGSQYFYNALGQEVTGLFWVHGRVLGKQYLHMGPHINEADMLMAIGWNGMMSHQIPQARRTLTQFSKNPDKLLVVVDPRRSETAKIADIHLAIRPGTDALLERAMISIILDEGWQNQGYIDQHVSGFETVQPWFKGFDIRAAIELCGLEYNQVREVCRQFATRKSCLRSDLGVLMNRHSTVVSYLEAILLAICGRICVPGGNIIPGVMMHMSSHSDERNKRTWRTVATDYSAIAGVFPPNVMPEEIMNDRPDRLRALIVSGANPLISYADTSAYEKAFKKLDLLVTTELAMTETAMLSDYVLPAKSAYESWDGTFFSWTFPEVFFQIRPPVLEPEGEQIEAGEVHVRLADALGFIPEIPQSLYEAAASGDRLKFGMALMEYIQAHPESKGMMPFILAKTLGKTLGSVNLASLWGLLQSMPKFSQENAARIGFKPGPTLGEEIFQSILDHPEGIWIGRTDPEANFEALATEERKVNIHIPELADWLRSIDPVSEKDALEKDKEYPLLLMAGRHMDMNANSLMRDPAWNKDRRACTVAMHTSDAENAGLKDGQTVRVATEAGEVTIELEVTTAAHPGHVTIPHGFGMTYQGETYGANVNRLTKNTHRDKLAGTPLHRYVPCKVTAM